MTRKRWIKLLMSRDDMSRNAARELAGYVAEQNASISQLNETLKKRGQKFRVTPIIYTDGFKPVLLAHLWEDGARDTAERISYSE